jgi:hypothetical protein
VNGSLFGIRQGRWKYIESDALGTRELLYPGALRPRGGSRGMAQPGRREPGQAARARRPAPGLARARDVRGAGGGFAGGPRGPARPRLRGLSEPPARA